MTNLGVMMDKDISVTVKIIKAVLVKGREGGRKDDIFSETYK